MAATTVSSAETVFAQARPRRGPTVETILYLLLLTLALATRFALLDDMALHHDEGIHAYYGWRIYTGQGYTHDAVYHGPLIYHMEALSFYLFGDSDATTRVMLATGSVATVMLPFFLRRQLGRWGALLASLLLLISPSFLYFGRFGHPDVFGAFFSLLLFVCVVRYLAEGTSAWLYGAAAATCLHFSAKPTAYIVTAIFLLYLGARVLWERYRWHTLWPLVGLLPAAVEDAYRAAAGGEFPIGSISILKSLTLSYLSLSFLLAMAMAFLLMLLWRWWESTATPSLRTVFITLGVGAGVPALLWLLGTTLGPLLPAEGLPATEATLAVPPLWSLGLVLGVGLAPGLFLLLLHFLARWRGKMARPADRSLDLVMVLGTVVLPLLSAVPLNLLISLTGNAALDYRTPQIPSQVIFLAAVAIAAMFIASAVLGLLWDPRRWGIVAGLFWGPFFVLHMSFFDPRALTGWATGLVQALGFWLTQQEVKRIYVGPQYFPILIVIYETVALVLGLIGVVWLGWKGLLAGMGRSPRPEGSAAAGRPEPAPLATPVGAASGLLVFWAPLSLFLYSMAGEQVPWLNLHPTLPLILVAAAFLGRVFAFRPRRPPAQTLRRAADGALLVTAALLLVWSGRPFFEEMIAGVHALGQPGGSAGEAWRRIAAGPLWLIGAALLLLLALPAFWGARKYRGEAAFLTLATAAVAMMGIGANLLSYRQNFEQWWTLYVPLGLLLFAWVVRAALLGKPALRSGVLVLFLCLSLYGFASAWRLTYRHNDTPVELLVYVQTSSDLQWAVDQTAALSTLTTGGTGLHILYDSEVAWPLEWYLRNYNQKLLQNTVAGPPSEDTAVVLVYRDKESTSSPYLEGRYQATRYYSFNWWFPEDGYRSAAILLQRVAPETLDPMQTDIGLAQALRGLLSFPGQARSWRYMLFREPLAPLGAREFAFYVRRDLVMPLELLRDSIRRR